MCAVFAHIRVIMKKTLPKIRILTTTLSTVFSVALVVCIAAVLCVGLGACNDTTSGNDGPVNPDYEKATYTVTFNTNSDFVLTESVLKNVVSGSKISAPKDADGNLIVPVKKGYTFRYWSADGVNEFNFATDTIRKNTTITAIYTNNVYRHTPVIDARLEYIRQADGSYAYEIVEGGYDGASLSAVELNPETTTIKSTYEGSLTELACPTARDGDKFRFWFYMQDGKPVQFTKWATEGASSVAMLAKYYFTKGLTLYAMYDSTLPRMDVEYCDSLSETIYKSGDSYPSNAQISQSDAYVATKTGYRFDKWYYTVVDEDGNSTDFDFTFADEQTSGTIINSATSTQDFFTPAKLTLKAKWIKQISVTSAQEYKTKLYDVLRKQDPTPDEQIAINQVLEADVTFADVDFSGIADVFEPLFDAEHVFVGTIDGGRYDANNALSSKATISNISVSGVSHASVFGYVAGRIKNIDFNGVTLSAGTNDKGVYDLKVTLAPVATQNEGSIVNVAVTNTSFNLVDGMNSVFVGGIAGENKGVSTSSDAGFISDCTASVNLSGLTHGVKAIVAGGICAQSNASSTLTRNSATVNVNNVVCRDDGISANGAVYCVLGGISGRNGGGISKSDARVEINSLSVGAGTTSVGGIAGDSTGSVTTSCATLTTTALSVANANVGGLVGKNEGYILNAYAIVNVSAAVSAQNTVAAFGGLVGNNFSEKSETSTSQTTGIGAINKSYAKGTIAVDNPSQQGSGSLFVGGIAGRNNKSKIGGVFALVDIAVTNVPKNDKTNLGFLFGSMEAKATINSGWYANENKISLNGVEYEYVYEGNDEDGNPIYSEPNFAITRVGTATQASDFTSKAWHESKSNTNLSSDVWILTDGSLPALKD